MGALQRGERESQQSKLEKKNEFLSSFVEFQKKTVGEFFRFQTPHQLFSQSFSKE